MATVDLNSFRSKMDEIDQALVKALIERMKLSQEIAQYKEIHGIPVRDEKREAELLRERMGHADSDEMAEAVRTVYEAILQASRDLQHKTMK